MDSKQEIYIIIGIIVVFILASIALKIYNVIKTKQEAAENQEVINTQTSYQPVSPPVKPADPLTVLKRIVKTSEYKLLYNRVYHNIINDVWTPQTIISPGEIAQINDATFDKIKVFIKEEMNSEIKYIVLVGVKYAYKMGVEINIVLDNNEVIILEESWCSNNSFENSKIKDIHILNSDVPRENVVIEPFTERDLIEVAEKDNVLKGAFGDVERNAEKGLSNNEYELNKEYRFTKNETNIMIPGWGVIRYLMNLLNLDEAIAIPVRNEEGKIVVNLRINNGKTFVITGSNEHPVKGDFQIFDRSFTTAYFEMSLDKAEPQRKGIINELLWSVPYYKKWEQEYNNENITEIVNNPNVKDKAKFMIEWLKEKAGSNNIIDARFFKFISTSSQQYIILTFDNGVILKIKYWSFTHEPIIRIDDNARMNVSNEPQISINNPD